MADEFTFYFTWTCPFTRPTWYHMTEPARQSCLHHTPQKRSSSTASLTTPSPKRRRKAHDTPTRYALQRMHPGTSPAVAVSSMSLWSILLDSPYIKIGTLTQFMYYTSQALVKGKTDSRTHPIPRSSGLKTLARSVGRQNRPSIARQAMRDPKIKKMVLNILEKDVQKELTKMSSKSPSICSY